MVRYNGGNTIFFAFGDGRAYQLPYMLIWLLTEPIDSVGSHKLPVLLDSHFTRTVPAPSATLVGEMVLPS